MAWFKTGGSSGGGQGINLLNPDVVNTVNKATANPDTTIAVTQKPRFIRYTYSRNEQNTTNPIGLLTYDIDNLTVRNIRYGSSGYTDTSDSFVIGGSGSNIKSVSDTQVVVTNTLSYPIHQFVEIWY